MAIIPLMISMTHQKQLDEDGFVILRDFISPERLQALRDECERIYAEQGELAGTEFRQEPQTRRLANVVNCGKIFEDLISEPAILALVRHVISDQFKFSSLNFRSSNPYSTWAQPLHCDNGATVDEQGFWICNVIWLLDDFTLENGATRMVPGSHHIGKLPQDVIADINAPHPDEILLVEKAGTVVVMNTHMWHGATANRTDQDRRALHSLYCRRDKPQQQYQKRLLSAETQQNLSPALRELLALDDSFNDEISSQFSNASGFLK